MKREKKVPLTLLGYVMREIEHQEVSGNRFTLSNCRSAMQSVLRFLGKKADTFRLEDVSGEWLLRYMLYMKETDDLSAGSRDCYMRVLRAVYNRAVFERLIPKQELNPFTGICIAVPPTLNRTLSVEELQLLMDLNLSGQSYLTFARDLFFSCSMPVGCAL